MGNVIEAIIRPYFIEAESKEVETEAEG